MPLESCRPGILLQAERRLPEEAHCSETGQARVLLIRMTTQQVKLTPAQVAESLKCARDRQQFHELRGTPDAHGFNGDGLRAHLVGALCECAVAVFVKQIWNRFSKDYKSIVADVGDRFQVRGTTHPCGNLILRDSDRDDQVFILARLSPPDRVELVGWTWGRYGKRTDYLWTDSDRPRCYKIPAEILLPMESLLE